jgi:hypothetical protein
MKCSQGQSNDGNCGGEAKGFQYCGNGPSTPLEDLKKCNKRSEEPTINKTIFPNTMAAYNWTSIPSGNYTTWLVFSRMVSPMAV